MSSAAFRTLLVGERRGPYFRKNFGQCGNRALAIGRASGQCLLHAFGGLGGLPRTYRATRTFDAVRGLSDQFQIARVLERPEQLRALRPKKVEDFLGQGNVAAGVLAQMVEIDENPRRADRSHCPNPTLIQIEPNSGRDTGPLMTQYGVQPPGNGDALKSQG
jgi:hypothetical protein